MAALTIIVGGGKLEGRISKKMHERIVKNFMDIIILAELRNRAMSGYDVVPQALSVILHTYISEQKC